MKYEIKQDFSSDITVPTISQPSPKSGMNSLSLPRYTKFLLPVVAGVLLVALLTPTLVLSAQHDDDGKKGSDRACETIPKQLNHCGVAGKWINQLKSTLELTCHDGKVSGKYNTLVGRASDYYELAGRYTIAGPDQKDCTLAWTVSWNNTVYGNSNSTTAWTGIHYDHEGIIHTQWILIRHHARSDLWKTSMIGHDEFTRVC